MRFQWPKLKLSSIVALAAAASLQQGCRSASGSQELAESPRIDADTSKVVYEGEFRLEIKRLNGTLTLSDYAGGQITVDMDCAADYCLSKSASAPIRYAVRLDGRYATLEARNQASGPVPALTVGTQAINVKARSHRLPEDSRACFRHYPDGGYSSGLAIELMGNGKFMIYNNFRYAGDVSINTSSTGAVAADLKVTHVSARVRNSDDTYSWRERTAAEFASMVARPPKLDLKFQWDSQREVIWWSAIDSQELFNQWKLVSCSQLEDLRAAN